MELHFCHLLHCKYYYNKENKKLMLILQILLWGGHYNFKSIFPEKGKYILFVNIKDIYYTDTTLNFIFELNVDDPIIDQFYNLLKSFFIDYYYIYVPIIIII